VERRRTLVRRAGLAGVALIVLAGATACEGIGPVGPSPAATVNGHDISSADVRDVVRAQRVLVVATQKDEEKQRAAAVKAEAQNPTGQAVPSAQDLAAQHRSQLAAFDGTGSDAISTGAASSALTPLVLVQIYADAVHETGGKVTDAQRTTARADVTKQLTDLGLKAADLSKVFVDAYVELNALQAALVAERPASAAEQPLSDAEYTKQLQAIYQSQRSSLTQLCADLIVAPNEAAGTAARKRLDAGEDFAAVAADVSQDPTAASGGKNCIALTNADAALGKGASTASKGDLFGPFDSGAGDGTVYLAKVDRIETPTFEDSRAQLEQANPNTQGADAKQAADDAFVQAKVDAAAARAKVTIDPRYGTWDPGSPSTGGSAGRPAQVLPPVDPGATSAAFTTDDGATTATSSVPASAGS